MSNLEQRIDLAYSKLGLREPFIAAVMTKIPREISERVPTAGTNGAWVRFNPTWCAPHTDEELFGLVLHECCHVVLMHMWRREGRDPALWNYANDAIINHYILSRGYSLPKGGVHIPWVKEEHSSEYVYMELKKNPPPPQKGGGGKGDEGGDPNAGGFDSKGDIWDAEDEATKLDMEATICAAAKMAKTCGHGSSLIDRVLANVGQSHVRWQDETRTMMTESCRADYSYKRFSRRFLSSGLYMPTLRSEALGGLAIGFDTSGSMGQKECDQIAAELREIIDDLQPEFVEVLYCDYDVTSVQRFDRDELLVLKPTGGGGTRFAPVFERVEASDEHYCGLIYFTDMEGNLSECIEPEIPVIWADIGTSHPAAPFGTRVTVPL